MHAIVEDSLCPDQLVPEQVKIPPQRFTFTSKTLLKTSLNQLDFHHAGDDRHLANDACHTASDRREKMDSGYERAIY